MSSFLGTLAITGAKTLFDAPNDGVKAIVIGNESGLTTIITMEGGGVQKTLYPSTVDWFPVRRGFTGTILINPLVILNNSASFPSSSLIFDAIGLNDAEEASQYPLNLARNTNIGNSVPLSTSATSIVNDSNPANTMIIESTVSGDGSSAVILKNDGTFVLGNATHKGSVSADNGKVTTDGNGALAATTVKSNTFRDNVAGNVAFDLSAGTGDVTVPHNLTISGTLTLANGTLTRVSIFTGSVGTTPTLFNHGLGTIPTAIWIQVTHTDNSSDNDVIIYRSDTMTSTQVQIVGNNATPRSFVALAIKS